MSFWISSPSTPGKPLCSMLLGGSCPLGTHSINKGAGCLAVEGAHIIISAPYRMCQVHRVCVRSIDRVCVYMLFHRVCVYMLFQVHRVCVYMLFHVLGN